MYLAQAAHTELAKTKGSLTVIASKTGLVAQRNSPLYVATKGAAIQLARALALDWAPEWIRVNAVCPGIVDTPMLQQFYDAMPDPAAFRRALARFYRAAPELFPDGPRPRLPADSTNDVPHCPSCRFWPGRKARRASGAACHPLPVRKPLHGCPCRWYLHPIPVDAG